MVRNVKENYLILVFFTVFGPQAGDPETTVEKQKDREDYFDLGFQVGEPGTYQDVNAQ